MASEGGGSGSGIASDFFFFLGILLLFFLVWVASGGPSRPISFQGPYLTPISPSGEATAYGDPDQYSNIGTGVSVGGWDVRATTGGGAKGNTSSLASIVGFAGGAGGAKEDEASREYVTLSVGYGATGAISTAGWKLVSQKTGQDAVFPQGTENPQSGRVNTLSTIQLYAGDTAVIVTGRSPVGVSFRENICTGYLEERQNFRPPLSQECPTPYSEYADYYDGSDDGYSCSGYMSSLSFCTAVTDVPSDVDNDCEAFAEEYLNYNGCLKAHAGDEDFPLASWRIFLGMSSELWREKGETILLLDAEGNVIDSLTY